MADLSPFVPDEFDSDLRVNLQDPWVDDRNHGSIGPITRARAKGLQSLTQQVLSKLPFDDERVYFESYYLHFSNNYHSMAIWTKGGVCSNQGKNFHRAYDNVLSRG